MQAARTALRFHNHCTFLPQSSTGQGGSTPDFCPNGVSLNSKRESGPGGSSAGGNVPFCTWADQGLELVARVSAGTIVRSSNCQVFRQTMVCFYAYLDIPEQSDGGLLNKNSLHLSSFFLSFFFSPFLLLFNEKEKRTLLAQSLKSLTCDANLSSLAPSQCRWLRACLISWLLIAGCVSVSIMKLSFKNVPEMGIQSSRQQVLTPCLVVQVWPRRSSLHLQTSSLKATQPIRGFLAYKGAPLELLGKASFLYKASFYKHPFEGISIWVRVKKDHLS